MKRCVLDLVLNAKGKTLGVGCILAALGFFALPLGGRGTPEQPINPNESLRLTQADVVVYTQRAQRGDAEAAMKLWQHYDFAEKKYVEGAHWKSRYDELRQRAHRNK
jgi:hypothetical protein